MAYKELKTERRNPISLLLLNFWINRKSRIDPKWKTEKHYFWKQLYQCFEESNRAYRMAWLTMRNTLYYRVAQWVGSDWKFSLHNRLPMKLVHLNSISAVNLTKPWQLHYGSQRLKELETKLSSLVKQWALQTKFINMGMPVSSSKLLPFLSSFLLPHFQLLHPHQISHENPPLSIKAKIS